MKRFIQVGLLCGAILSCGLNSKPDDNAFWDLVVNSIVEGAKNKIGKTIVIESSFSFEGIDSKIQTEIKNRLEALGCSWKNLNLSGDISTFSDFSDFLSEKILINPDNFLLTARVRKNGNIRSLMWRYTCGSLCGGGKDIDFRWVNGTWKNEKNVIVRF